ncbi:TonB-dependent vitamin B12 receptor [Lysobacter sp. H21R4]|uniref:TonB-dependent vitamin B12 receptor n=1 Tax=Lysobacter sp. H21R4 TaxID=2781021 RepID=UPI0018890191|nr:TonB-dependent vitamin B12 receptor [Lysobacter sp. H21R4]QOY62436.1 TonB-dependent vitamin B12 receptor [Lysobacter sp. H21R4]
MRSTPTALAAAIAAGLAVAAFAPAANAAPTPAPLAQATDLDQVIVTATRTVNPVADVLAPVEVIDRDAIERSQARSVTDLLRGRAGISISNQGGAGKLTSLFLRGADSDHTVVLVDGVRIGSSTSGLAAWQNLPVELIERIEIVRGPRSSLYGADAIGGVIQIFTRRDGDAGFAPRMHVGGGSNGAHEFGTGFGGRTQRSWFGADYAFQRTEGFNACDPAPSPFGGCGLAAPEPDKDGYIQNAISLRGGYDFNDAWQLQLHAMRSEGENEYDGDYTNYAETVQQVVGGSLSWQASERAKVSLTAGRNVDSSDQYKDEAFMGGFSTDRDSATLQADLTLAPAHVLTLGADWSRDQVSGDTAYEVDSRSNRAAFAQVQSRLGAHRLEASVRRDDNDQFGGHTTGGLGWGMDIAGGWRIKAGWGTAFKAPNFLDLYYPYFGNPDLVPEESETAEIGLGWSGHGWNVDLDAFHTKVDNLIAFDGAIGLPGNVDRARMRGAELGVRGEVAEWTMDASFSVVDTENRSGGFQDGNELPRRAGKSARASLDRAFGDFRFGLTGIAEGSRYDDVANTVSLPGYATLDLRAEYALTDALSVQAKLANAFDRDYRTAAYYNQAGREWHLTLRWTPRQ